MLLNSEDVKIKLLSKKLMEVIKDNEGDELRNMKICGNTMKTLREIRHSNFMLNYCRAPISNRLMCFLLKARTGLIMTPERKYLIGFGDEATRRCRCDKGGICNLAHILNGYSFYLSIYHRDITW
jgi:hypothetical protein